MSHSQKKISTVKRVLGGCGCSPDRAHSGHPSVDHIRQVRSMTVYVPVQGSGGGGEEWEKIL